MHPHDVCDGLALSGRVERWCCRRGVGFIPNWRPPSRVQNALWGTADRCEQRNGVLGHPVVQIVKSILLNIEKQGSLRK